MKISGGEQTSIAQINATGWDANLIVPAARIITVDHIAETTPAHGIVHDNVCAVAGGVQLQADHIAERTGGHLVTFDVAIQGTTSNFVTENADHLGEMTGGHSIILNNTETGRQTGTGNSATGAVLAHVLEGVYNGGSVSGGKIGAVIARRAGTFHVHGINTDALPAAEDAHLYIGDVDQGTLCPGGAAAYTETNLGDVAVAAGDVINIRFFKDAGNYNGVINALFYNADGMWI